jgi:hypothetical protein
MKTNAIRISILVVFISLTSALKTTCQVPVPPTVFTYSAIQISPDTAVLRGGVNANGYSTTVGFDYGLTYLYGNSLPADPSVVVGSETVSISANLSGLVPNTLYHFRSSGVNSGGRTNGMDMTFTTQNIVATNAPTKITCSSAFMHGTVNANKNSTTVSFQYGLTTSYGSSIALPVLVGASSFNTPESAYMLDLSPLTIYHYRIVGVDVYGTFYGADAAFRTTAQAPPPIVISNPATAVNFSTATLNGAVDPNCEPATILFEYGTSTQYGVSVPAEWDQVNGPTVYVYADLTDLQPNTQYHFRCKGTNSGGTVYGDDLLFTTIEKPYNMTIESGAKITVNGDLIIIPVK